MLVVKGRDNEQAVRPIIGGMLRQLDGFRKVRRPRGNYNIQPVAVFERNFGNLSALNSRERGILAGGAEDNHTISSILLQVSQDILVHGLIKVEVLVAGRNRRYPEQHLFPG